MPPIISQTRRPTNTGHQQITSSTHFFVRELAKTSASFPDYIKGDWFCTNKNEDEDRATGSDDGLSTTG